MGASCPAVGLIVPRLQRRAAYVQQGTQGVERLRRGNGLRKPSATQAFRDAGVSERYRVRSGLRRRQAQTGRQGGAARQQAQQLNGFSQAQAAPVALRC